MSALTPLIVVLCITLTAAQGARVLTVSTLLQPPYVMTDKPSSENATYKGFINDLLGLLGKSLRLDFELVPVADRMFGVLLPNGTWTGTVGQVVTGKADMAAGPITVTAARSMFVDFTQPFQFTGPVIVMKKPDDSRPPFKDRLLHVLKPFTNAVWFLSVMAFLLTGSILYIVSYTNPYEWRRMSHDGEATLREGESFTCLNSFWFTISAIFLQGFTRAPRSAGGRIVVSFWWFFVVVFLASYIGNLSNLLRMGPQPGVLATVAKVRSVDDLANNEDITLHVVRSSSTHGYIMNSRISVYQTIADKISMNKESLVDTVDDAMALVESSLPGSRAAIVESAMAKYYTEQASCKLYYINDQMLTTQYSLMLPTGSQYLKPLNQALLALAESGDLRRLKSKWFRGHCTNYMLENSEKEKFDIPHFYAVDLGLFSGALFILAIGLVLGGLVTVIETAIYKFAETDEPVKNASPPTPQRSDTDKGANPALLQPPGPDSGQRNDFTAV